MSDKALVLTTLFGSWPFVGYFATRLWHAFDLGSGDCKWKQSGRDWPCRGKQSACPRNHARTWWWNRPFASEDGVVCFWIGVIGGWITAVVMAVLLAIFVVCVSIAAFFRFITPKTAR